MKETLYTTLLTLFLSATNGSTKNNSTSATVERTKENTTITTSTDENEAKTLELSPKEITKEDFEKYKRVYKTNCTIETNGFISGYDLTVSHNCDEICETFLVEKSSGKQMLLPSNYDEGIMGMLFSPSCNQFLIFSSYDGPDYEDYYAHRAEIIGFKITKEKGLKAVKSAFTYKSKDWSIADLTWINDTSVALKTYSEARWGDGSRLNYKYYKIELDKK